jgi:hypothetical protein
VAVATGASRIRQALDLFGVSFAAGESGLVAVLFSALALAGAAGLTALAIARMAELAGHSHALRMRLESVRDWCWHFRRCCGHMCQVSSTNLECH